MIEKEKYLQIVGALKVAQVHIMKHHDCSIEMRVGEFCPVCHRKDGSEPEMNEISEAIAVADKLWDGQPVPMLERIADVKIGEKKEHEASALVEALRDTHRHIENMERIQAESKYSVFTDEAKDRAKKLTDQIVAMACRMPAAVGKEAG